MSNAIKIVCKRCGQCCANGGPTLHGEDLGLFASPAALDLTDLLTIRVGERVHNQPLNRIEPLEAEVVKITHAPEGRTCIFYNDAEQACAIYDNRPAECRALFCRDTSDLEAMYDKGRIARRDILPEGHPLLELVEEHDQACSVTELARLARLVLDSEDRNATEAIGSMLAYDEAVREAVVTRGGLPETALPFLFGRPMVRLLGTFGLNVRRDDGKTVLVPNPLTA